MVNDLNEGLTPVEAQPPISEWPDLEEIGRETNFCDRANLYEVIHADGSGHGVYTSHKAAAAAARPCDRVAMAVYTRTGEATYVEDELPNDV